MGYMPGPIVGQYTPAEDFNDERQKNAKKNCNQHIVNQIKKLFRAL